MFCAEATCARIWTIEAVVLTKTQVTILSDTYG